MIFFLVQTSETYENKQNTSDSSILRNRHLQGLALPLIYSYLQNGTSIQNDNPLSILQHTF